MQIYVAKQEFSIKEKMNKVTAMCLKTEFKKNNRSALAKQFCGKKKSRTPKVQLSIYI